MLFGINDTHTEQGLYSIGHLPTRVLSFAYPELRDIHIPGGHVQLHATPEHSHYEEQL